MRTRRQDSIIECLIKALGQLGDRRVAGIILGSVLATLALFAILFWIVAIFVLPFLAFTGIHLVNALLEILGGAGVAVTGWFLFPAFVGIVASLFLESVADAVEDRHYPELPAAPGQSITGGLWTALKFTGVVIVANVIVLPLYLVPVLNMGIFYVLNGYLLGREYYELVALRRLDERTARALRRANRAALFTAGLVITLMTTIPVLNLLTPVVATAFMTHVFQNLRQRAPARA